jgi:hypothetical protein
VDELLDELLATLIVAATATTVVATATAATVAAATATATAATASAARAAGLPLLRSGSCSALGRNDHVLFRRDLGLRLLGALLGHLGGFVLLHH